MSSEAITRRIRQASQLRDLSLSLMKAKKAHDDKIRKEREETAQETTGAETATNVPAQRMNPKGKP